MEDSFQTEKERRAIRHSYRELYQDTVEHKHELLAEKSIDSLGRKLSEANQLFSKVCMPREGVLDAQLFSGLSNLGEERMRGMSTNFLKFKPVEFAERLVVKVTGQQADAQRELPDDFWAKVAMLLPEPLKRSPPLTYMYGSFENVAREPKPRKERQKASQKEMTSLVQGPKQLASFDESDKFENTSREVEKVMAALKKSCLSLETKSICFFQFVVNPFSYAKTIENIFHVSFLVREGRVRISLDDDKLPIIEPIELTPEIKKEHAAARNNQFIVSLSHDEWQDIIATFNIQSSVIQSGPPA